MNQTDDFGGEQGLGAPAGMDSERPAEVTMRQHAAADSDAVIGDLAAGASAHNTAMGQVPGDDGAPSS